jgi:hypothetical protein
MQQRRVSAWLLVAACIVLLARPNRAEAYPTYSENKDATYCAACHGDFRAGGYLSSHDGTAWGTSLMSGHNTMVSSNCGVCHTSPSKFPVYINSSDGGGSGLSTAGCLGCHGREADAGHGVSDGRGAGLRQHHDRNGITVCRGCHADANTAMPAYTPVSESVEPFNYFTPDSSHPYKPTDACDANGTESIYGATGLDNDGNGLYDGADPACSTTTTTLYVSTTTTLGGTTTTTLGSSTTTTLGGTTTTTWGSSTTTTLGGSTTTTLVGITTTTLSHGTTTTTLPDMDGDGIPDVYDPCNNSGAHDITIKPKVIVKKIDAVPDNDGLLVKGEFVSAAPLSDITGERLRVVGLRNDLTTAFDIPIYGDVYADAKKILFKDKTGSNGGIIKLQLKDRSKKAPNQVKVLVKGKNGTYPFAIGDEPIRVTVVIGDGLAGECGETAFGPGACAFNGSGKTLKCR